MAWTQSGTASGEHAAGQEEQEARQRRQEEMEQVNSTSNNNKWQRQADRVGRCT